MIGYVATPFNGSSSGVIMDNKFTALGTVGRDGNNFSFSLGYAWQLNGGNYANSYTFDYTIEPASEGYYRSDIAYVTTDNKILYLAGEENETGGIPPAVPVNCMLLGTWSIFGTTISDIENPFLGQQYVQKSFSNETIIFNSPETFSVLNALGSSAFVFKSSDTPFDFLGFTDIDTFRASYDGKIYSIKNATDFTITLKNNLEGEFTPFIFTDNKDFKLQPNQIVLFRYSQERNKLELFGNSDISKDLKGTNQVLLILDGSPAQNTEKINNVFYALPNDGSLFSIMTLGGTVDSFPDFSERPYTSFGSLDENNPVVCKDLFTFNMEVNNIKLLNIKFNGGLITNYVINNCSFKKITSNINIELYAIDNSYFNEISAPNIQITVCNNSTFINVKTDQFIAQDYFENSYFISSEIKTIGCETYIGNCNFDNIKSDNIASNAYISSITVSNSKIGQINAQNNIGSVKITDTIIFGQFKAFFGQISECKFDNCEVLGTIDAPDATLGVIQASTFKNSKFYNFSAGNIITNNEFINSSLASSDDPNHAANCLFYNCKISVGLSGIANARVVNCLDASNVLLNQ